MNHESQQDIQGLNLLYTGNGKGKTTAALGLMFRAWGDHLSVGCIQFIKSADHVKGEKEACLKLGIPFLSLGKGFVFSTFNAALHEEAARHAWEVTRETILFGKLDLLVLDEITYLFIYKWLDIDLFVDWIKANKPSSMHLVMTGRDAPQKLIDFADMVTEVREIKHHFKESGIPAQIGIEY